MQAPFTPEKLAAQATVYAELLDACVSSKACKAFVLWGFTDKYSWVPGSFPGFGSALIFGSAYEPKPAYWSLLETLRRH